MAQSKKLLTFSMKSISRIENYPLIIESFNCIFVLPMNFLISFGIYLTPNLSKYVTLSPFKYKAIQKALIDLQSSTIIRKKFDANSSFQVK